MANLVPEKWLTEGPLSDANKEGLPYFRLTEYLFDKTYQKDSDQTQDSIFNRNLRIKEQLLIANELAAEDEDDLINDGEEARKAALKKITGLILSGRDFRYADFSEARLPKVNFEGADSKPSNLNYANFYQAMLTNARLNNSALQGANLLGAKLQGADLFLANLQGAVLANANLTLSNLSGAQFDPLTDQELASLFDEMSKSIDDTKRRNQVKKTLTERTLKPTTLAEATGEYIWADEPYGDVVHTLLYGFGNNLNAAENESKYQHMLTTYLIELSCQDQWRATGIIKYRINEDSFGSNLSQCLLLLKDQKNQSDQLVCPALSRIDEATVTRLKEIVANNDPDNPTQHAFICQTELSDPPSGSTNP